MLEDGVLITKRRGRSNGRLSAYRGGSLRKTGRFHYSTGDKGLSGGVNEAQKASRKHDGSILQRQICFK